MEPDDLSAANALIFLGHCAQKPGRPGEAGTSFKRSLEIVDVKVGPDDVLINFSPSASCTL